MEARIKALEEKFVALNNTLDKLNENVETLLARDGDFTVAVINGKTEHRPASELIGEMYMQMKDIKTKTTDASIERLKNRVKDGVSVFTLVLLVIAILKNWLQ